MKCSKCPLNTYYETENDSVCRCELFGDGWDHPLQYANKSGDIVGCYVMRRGIDAVDRKLYEEFMDIVGESVNG